jgi:4a-hydroxytetrahydrobiopterin dehydratase
MQFGAPRRLVDQTCTWPCDPSEIKCSVVEATARLQTEGLSARWGVTEEPEAALSGTVQAVPKLLARVQLPDFASAAALAARVAALAEAEGHFPDITFGWQYLELRVFTHVANGLCHNDFILVAKLDQLLHSPC